MKRPSFLTIYFALYVISIFLPLAFVFLFSFNDSLSAGFPWRGFTLKWWKTAFENPEVSAAVVNSAMIACSVAPAAAGFGLLAAMAIVRRTFWGQNAFLYLTIAVLCAPYTLIGAGLLAHFSRLLHFDLGPQIIGIGHLIVALPVTTLVMMARLIGFDRSIEEAAMDLGASEFETFRKITFPILMPGFISALFMGFVTSLEDVILAYFLSRGGATVPVYIYSALRRRWGLPMIMALSSFMILIGLALAAIFLILSKKGIMK